MSRSTPPRVLHGQVAAITGGARGIGKATAHALLREGMAVAICDLDDATVQSAVAELATGGGTVRGYVVNVADRDAVRAFVDAVESELGPIDVFDNNAGIMPVGRFLDETPEATDRQIAVNIDGVINGTRAILPRFEARGRGHLINVASMAASCLPRAS